jgi:hypothetical protein
VSFLLISSSPFFGGVPLWRLCIKLKTRVTPETWYGLPEPAGQYTAFYGALRCPYLFTRIRRCSAQRQPPHRHQTQCLTYYILPFVSCPDISPAGSSPRVITVEPSTQDIKTLFARGKVYVYILRAIFAFRH